MTKIWEKVFAHEAWQGNETASRLFFVCKSKGKSEKFKMIEKWFKM